MTQTVLAELREESLKTLSRLSGVFRAPGNARAALSAPGRTSEGTGLEFREFREYHAGDDSRRVDWRTTLRRGRPYVRTFESETSATWYVCIDASASMSRPDPMRWRLANQLAGALSYILLDGGNRVGLVAPASSMVEYIRAAHGRRQYVRIAGAVSRLLQYPPGGSGGISRVGVLIPPDAHLVLVSDFLQEDAMIGDLHRLQRRGRRIDAIRIQSRTDVRTTARGPAALVDVESGERLSAGPDATESARIRLAELEDALCRYCARAGIRLSRCDADTHWSRAILNHARGHYD